ncbi:MAG: response regulator [Candidatus Omnitrophica bacterium]|nr:response regulator [Candidatus Omnitrophota bacterium]
MAKKILIIEDEKLITKTLQKLLKKEGYEVEIANNGADAIERAKEKDFDLIVSDIRMPLMDGIETIKVIRENRQEAGKPLIPEIIITGYADEEKYKSAVDLKVAAYIYKPFDTEEFLEAIRNNIK